MGRGPSFASFAPQTLISAWQVYDGRMLMAINFLMTETIIFQRYFSLGLVGQHLSRHGPWTLICQLCPSDPGFLHGWSSTRGWYRWIDRSSGILRKKYDFDNVLHNFGYTTIGW
jgi:hypothetical protein